MAPRSTRPAFAGLVVVKLMIEVWSAYTSTESIDLEGTGNLWAEAINLGTRGGLPGIASKGRLRRTLLRPEIQGSAA